LILDPDRAQQTNWNLIDGPGRRNGGMVAVGVGGALTGRSADVMIIDDSVKNSKQADSAEQRKHILDWYQAVATTRLSPGAIVIIIGTRWHEDDLMGYLMRQDGLALTPDFHHLIIPAQAKKNDALGREPGEYLNSTRRRTPEDWKDIERRVGERFWSALYQADPHPPAGGVFKLAWINNHRVKAAPELLKTEVFVDPADNEGDGDEAGIIVAGRGIDSHYYILADESGHMSVASWFRAAHIAAFEYDATAIRYERSLSGLRRSAKQAWKDVRREALKLYQLQGNLKAWPKLPDGVLLQQATQALCRDDAEAEDVLAMERGLKELWPHVPKVMRLTEAGIPIRGFTARGSKSFRAQMVAPLHETGKVHHVGFFMELVHQMVAWQESQDSPDRMDAAVHAIDQLSANQGEPSLNPAQGTLPTRQSQESVNLERLGSMMRRT
jgi:hypothetical protein